LEGRRTFANTLKYIRMGTSSNFGNMLRHDGAALILPFLPMTPGQILLNNLIYDASPDGDPTDAIDPMVAAVPAHWDVHAIQRFMLIFGPISSLFDYATFGVLLWVLGANEKAFHTGWFVESLFTQVLVVLVIRNPGFSPFWRSRPSTPLMAAIVAALVAAVAIPLSPLGDVLASPRSRLPFWGLLVVLVAAYLGIVELAKRRFEPRPDEASATYSGSGRHPISVDRSGRSRWIRRCSASNSAMRRVRSRMTAAQSCSASNPLWSGRSRGAGPPPGPTTRSRRLAQLLKVAQGAVDLADVDRAVRDAELVELGLQRIAVPTRRPDHREDERLHPASVAAHGCPAPVHRLAAPSRPEAIGSIGAPAGGGASGPGGVPRAGCDSLPSRRKDSAARTEGDTRLPWIRAHRALLMWSPSRPVVGPSRADIVCRWKSSRSVQSVSLVAAAARLASRTGGRAPWVVRGAPRTARCAGRRWPRSPPRDGHRRRARDVGIG